MTVLVNLKYTKVATNNYNATSEDINFGKSALAIFLLVVPFIIFGIKLLSLAVNNLPLFFLWLLVYLFYAMRVVMILLLNEKHRLANYKKHRISKYQNLADVTSISNIKDNVVYLKNGTVKVFLVCRNGSKIDSINNAPYIADMLSEFKNTDYTIYLWNIPDSEALKTRYKNVKEMSSIDAQVTSIKTIKYNKDIIDSTSSSITTIYEIKSYMRDVDRILDVLNKNIPILKKNVYKEIHIADEDEIDYILNRSLMTDVSYSELIEDNIESSEWYGSKILGYDSYKPNKDREEVNNEENLNWLPKEE